MSQDQTNGFDPTDPHGYHAGEHHGHVIISPFTLTAVLAALVFFTVLTVGVSRAEIWIADMFHLNIPHWVNVVVALSIAVVKSILVCGIFMQLKYDKPLNSLIFLFCLFAVALFLGFSMMDMGTQGLVYKYSQDQIVVGGTGVGQNAQESDLRTPDGTIIVSRNGLPIIEWAKLSYKAKVCVENGWVDEDGKPTPTGMARAEEVWRNNPKNHHPDAHDHGPELSSADKSRPRHGLTPGLFDEGHAAPHDAAGSHTSGH